MFDKITINLDRAYLPLNPTNIANYLTDVTEEYHKNNEQYYTIRGNLNGLRVAIRQNGVFITGSLAKYFYSNNMETLSRTDTKQAVTRLSDEIHTNLDNGKVTGIEFGKNFVLTSPVCMYLHRLLDYPRLLRVSHSSSTIYFKQKGKRQTKVLAFYDKIQEMKNKKIEIPFGLEEYNVLRYEMRLKRLPQFLGFREVTPVELYDKDIYHRLVTMYVSEYNKIKKMCLYSMDKEITTIADGFNLFVGNVINQVGKSHIDTFINDLRAKGVYRENPSYYSKLKRKLINTISIENGTADELVKELNNELINVKANPI